VVVQVQAIATAESTVAALERAVRAEVDKLQLSPLDRADAEDLITLLAVALESRFQGPMRTGVVQVNECCGWCCRRCRRRPSFPARSAKASALR